MTYVQLSGPKDRKIAWLRPMMEQDVDLSAVSAVVDVSSADGIYIKCRVCGFRGVRERRVVRRWTTAPPDRGEW